MMRSFSLLLISLLMLCTFSCFGQQSSGSTSDICTHLRATGRVTLLQSDKLSLLIADPVEAAKLNQNNGKIMTQGYRIRVFSGNQQSVSKNKAYEIRTKLTEFMPELETYVIFKSPNWRLTAGNFRTSEEAHAALRILKNEFPAYGKEMFVVQEEIEL